MRTNTAKKISSAWLRWKLDTKARASLRWDALLKDIRAAIQVVGGAIGAIIMLGLVILPFYVVIHFVLKYW